MQKDTRFAGLCFVEISPIMAFFRRRPKQLKMHEKTFRLVILDITKLDIKNDIAQFFDISGLLGTITKTADVSDCPGKCLHALASLLCEEVKEDIACPSNSMRCCVDRKHLKRPNTAIDETSNLETTTNYRVRPVPARTTIATTTTTRTTTTTSRPAAVASDKQDKFGDYDYTDTTSDNSSASTTSKTASSVFFAAVLCMTFYFL